jgi:hypothetical protein
MKLILNSSVARTVTSLLLVFLTQYNNVKSYRYTLQKMLDGDFTLKNGLIKAIICNNDGLKVKYTEFNMLITRPLYIIKNAGDSIVFAVSKGKNRVIVINTGLMAVINQTIIISTYVKPGGYIISLLKLPRRLTPSILNNQLFTAAN